MFNVKLFADDDFLTIGSIPEQAEAVALYNKTCDQMVAANATASVCVFDGNALFLYSVYAEGVLTAHDEI